MTYVKYFTIHENDAGTEAYHDSYVLELEDQVARLKTHKTNLNATICLQRRQFEQLEKVLRVAAGELSMYGSHTTQHPQEVYDELLSSVQQEIQT